MAINEMLKLFHKYNMPPYLAGIKLHKKDDFLLSYSLDGFSIGFDFPVLPNRLQKQESINAYSNYLKQQIKIHSRHELPPVITPQWIISLRQAATIKTTSYMIYHGKGPRSAHLAASKLPTPLEAKQFNWLLIASPDSAIKSPSM